MRHLFQGLWRRPDFLRLWTSQTASRFGYQISFLALPLLAALILNATPTQMGILIAVGSLPGLFFGILAGAWIDRYRRRPIMVAVDWGRALLLLVVPLAAALDVLRIELLYFVTFGIGLLTLFFDVAYRSLLPTLIDRTQIIEGNSKLEIGRSAADIAGPGAAGVLVHLVTAPLALLANSATFVISALLLQSIRTSEPVPKSTMHVESIWKDAGRGLGVVATNPVLRALAISSAVIGLFNALQEAVGLLYMTRQLDLSPGSLGLIFSVGSLGALIGATMAKHLSERIGLGPSIILGVLLVSVGDLILPLVGGSTLAVFLWLILSELVFVVGIMIYGIGQISIRQIIAPNHLQGRVNAVIHVAGISAIPVGALLGGILGEIMGLRSTLFVAVGGELLAVVILLFSWVRKLRNIPTGVL